MPEVLMLCPVCQSPTLPAEAGKERFCAKCWAAFGRDEGQMPPVVAEGAGRRAGEAVGGKARRKTKDYAVVLVGQLWAWAQGRPGRVEFCTEFRFHPTRMWRFDVAFTRERLAVEVDGGNRMAVIGKNGKPVAVGQHAQAEDYQKMNEATLLGWRVLRFLPSQVRSGEALAAIEKGLETK